jgi:hypothetical protein
MRSFKTFFVLFFIIAQYNCIAQDNLFARFTTRENQKKIYGNLINNTIYKNLSLSLDSSSEANWQDAFEALELLLMRSDVIDKKINNAFEMISLRSTAFQRALLELAFTNYPSVYVPQVTSLFQQTGDVKIFAMCAEYLLQNDSTSGDMIREMISKRLPGLDHPILTMLNEHITRIKYSSPALIKRPSFTDLLDKRFLPGEIVLYSFQRKDRNYPGMVVIRNREGKFISDDSGEIFFVPQLARSISNLPSYLTNGNTPQGIFKMHGFDVSTSTFIGPSPNIQLAMPGESSLRYFFADSTIQDTTWTKEWYARLLPASLKNYSPMYDVYYAGLAGRTEIISHGTTVDPEIYKGKPYYPHTPTQGCLCTKEVWDGKRIESNQKKLIEAMLKAGGAEGYCVVVELDDTKAPVSIEELLPYLSKTTRDY